MRVPESQDNTASKDKVISEKWIENNRRSNRLTDALNPLTPRDQKIIKSLREYKQCPGKGLKKAPPWHRPEVLSFKSSWLVMLFDTANGTWHCKKQNMITGVTLNHFKVTSWTSAWNDCRMSLKTFRTDNANTRLRWCLQNTAREHQCYSNLLGLC
jgi:hypothetical protein